MKKNLLTLMLAVIVTATTNAQGTVGKDCSQLFFTEIISSVTLATSPNTGLKHNYALEIFNPVQAPINLSNYSLKLTKANNTYITIPLSGTISAWGTWVICHCNADTLIKGTAACSTASLDFSQYVCVELQFGSGTIDAFGEKSTMVVNLFNYLQFVQNPVAYVSTNKIGLNSLQFIDLRRSMLCKQGVPTFTSIAVFGRWAFNLGNNFTDLGHYKGTCNRSPEDLPIIGYTDPVNTTPIDEDYNLNNAIDDLPLTVNVAGTYLVNQGYIAATTANINVDVCFSSCSNAVNNYWTSTNAATPGANYLKTTNNLFVGQKGVYIQLTTVNNDFTPDNSAYQHFTAINGDKTAGIKENYLSAIKIAPTVTSDKITIKNAVSDGTYKVIDVNGKVVLNENFSNDSNIDVSALSNGMYFLILQSQSEIATHKFIKQ